MNKQREALDALEGIHPGNMTPMAEQAWNKAINAIREALVEPEQEPVAWMLMNDTQCHIMATDWKPEDSDGWKTAPLYTAPPARKSLTDEEIDNLELPPNGGTMRELVRVVERAHGIDGGHDCWR